MPIILDTDNVFDYLAQLDYCTIADRQTSQMTVISAKNFNLAIAFADGKSLLVKQELYNPQGETLGEFWSAWQIQRLVREFPEFGNEMSDFLPELLHFDPDSSILIVNFRTDYRDLYGYYAEERHFPIEVARSIGLLLGTIHSQTFEQAQYREFLADRSAKVATFDGLKIIDRLSRITPQVFRKLPQDCLQFYKLYQRFPTLSQAIVELRNSVLSSCLVHNDLKINNILLALDWEQPDSKLISLIDWERANWGDPAFDLGCILGGYLELWLEGLVISSTLSINESLQLATTPLELLQPSLFTLVQTYLDRFPAILAARPDFLNRSIQFAGLSLIIRLETMVEDERTFGNQGIIILQVAKQLLCAPQAAMNTLFGSNSAQLIIK
jgi:Phosphotransferase enzyme family